MTTSDRCLCDHLMPSLRSRCPEHGGPDAILASGQYVDRMGRVWVGAGTDGVTRYWMPRHGSRACLPESRMRALIERDLHRDECPGLKLCYRHPAPHVIYWRGSRHYVAYNLATRQTETHPTLGAALDAARHMAGATP